MPKAYVNYDDELYVAEFTGWNKKNGDFLSSKGNTIYKGHHFTTKKAAILDLIQQRLDDISRLSAEINEIKEKYNEDLL